jgi:hypothetical protein
VTEVGRVDGDFGSDDDLLLGADRLRVVALDPPARGLDVTRIQIAEIDLAAGTAGGSNGLGGRPNFLPFLSTPRAR